MRAIFTLDGKEYTNIHVTELKRSFSVLDGKNTGRVMTGDMTRDIIGTFYNYTMGLDQYMTDPEEYDELYEILSAPAASHDLAVPYGQSVLSFKAYVTGGEDSLYAAGDINEWSGLSVNFVAMSPQRRPI